MTENYKTWLDTKPIDHIITNIAHLLIKKIGQHYDDAIEYATNEDCREASVQMAQEAEKELKDLLKYIADRTQNA